MSAVWGVRQGFSTDIGTLILVVLHYGVPVMVLSRFRLQLVVFAKVPRGRAGR